MFYNFSVDFTKFPGMADVEYYHVNLSAGDCLYIPYKWYVFPLLRSWFTVYDDDDDDDDDDFQATIC